MTLSKLKDGTFLDVSKVILIRKIKNTRDRSSFGPVRTEVMVNDSIFSFNSERDADNFIEEIYELSTK